MLDIYPDAVAINGLLKAQFASCEQAVKLVMGKAVEERNLLRDLVDRLFKRREVALKVGGLLKVHAHDGNAIGELLHILARASNSVVVVEIAELGEQTSGGTASESNDQSLLLAAGKVEDFNHGTGSANGQVDDFLVDLLGVVRCLLPEAVVGNKLESRFLGVSLLWRLAELALIDEVAAEGGLGAVIGTKGARRTESLDPELGLADMVKVFGLKPLLIPGAVQARLSRFAGIDVDGMVLGLHVKADLLSLVLAGKRRNLGSVQGGNLASNHARLLQVEVYIVNTELFIEKLDLIVDLRGGDQASLLNKFCYCNTSKLATC